MLQGLRHRPWSSALLIFGLLVAILSITLGISRIQARKEIEDLSAQHEIQFEEIIYIKLEDRGDLEAVFSILEKSPYSFAVQARDFFVPIDNMNVVLYPSYINGEATLDYPILEGRNFDSSDFASKAKLAVVGKSIAEEIGSWIEIGGEKYQVIGRTGFADFEVPPYSQIKAIPILSLPPQFQQQIVQEGKILLGFRQREEGFAKYFSDALTAEGLEQGLSPMGSSATSGSDEVSLAMTSGLIYGMAILNTFNISIFWIRGRKREIGIRKAFGYTNGDILLLLIRELGELMLIATLLALGVHLAISPISEYLFGVRLGISWVNAYAALLFIFFTVLISVILPGWMASKVDPATSIRG
ncbi:MAG: FtsX-like permease family protein [Tissierellia bacterium]|nr:FtsX-like permease family protein [Tissierellia bacterium]